jgi:hypothetical protein
MRAIAFSIEVAFSNAMVRSARGKRVRALGQPAVEEVCTGDELTQRPAKLALGLLEMGT